MTVFVLGAFVQGMMLKAHSADLEFGSQETPGIAELAGHSHSAGMVSQPDADPAGERIVSDLCTGICCLGGCMAVAGMVPSFSAVLAARRTYDEQILIRLAGLPAIPSYRPPEA